MSTPIPDELKKQIQSAYSTYLESRAFRARYGQRLMIAEIVKGLYQESGKSISVVEAGTGTGKTVAYLLAAIPVAAALKKKLVVSTATVALQEQIIHKDLPDLLKHSGLSFTFELVKGRGRYLCLSKLDNLLNNQQSDPNRALYDDELDLRLNEGQHALYQSLGEAYAKGDWDGDRDNWPQELDQQDWQLITTDHRQCTNRRCSHFSGCCFFQSRQGLEQADCVVANHDLVLSDLALGGGAILPEPEEAIYIFDEGHHLPDKALQHFSYQLRLKSTQNWLKQINKSSGRMLREMKQPEALVRSLTPVEQLVENISELQDNLYPLLTQLQSEVTDDRDDNCFRFADGVVPDSITEMAAQLSILFGRLVSQLDATSETLKEAIEDPLIGIPRELAENWFPLMGRLLSRAEASWALWRDFAEAGEVTEVPQARWLMRNESPEGEDCELSSSPILAADTLRRHLWERCAGAVVTSATLTALGQFDRLMMRSGIPDQSRFSRVPSPFDYNTAAKLNIPKIQAAPSDIEAHDKAVAESLEKIIDEKDAALVLFTSWRQMLSVQEKLNDVSHLEVIAQGMYSKQEILKRHCQRVEDGKGSVLFGLASFAEGVDLPGELLTHVVIAKIPFSVPGDPVESALYEWVRKQGRDPFMEITVPDASVKLVQACGRLLRSESDRGQITLLDNRLLSRRYGQALLNALPPFRR